jgi:hypothetical protein
MRSVFYLFIVETVAAKQNKKSTVHVKPDVHQPGITNEKIIPKAIRIRCNNNKAAIVKRGFHSNLSGISINRDRNKISYRIGILIL